MTRNIAGLTWDVPSPSFYRLASAHIRGAIVDVSFVGDRWIMFFCRNGQVRTRSFETRDEAIGMVMLAFRNEGVVA